MVKNLDKRSKAVGGARGIADDRFIRVVEISIDTNNICGDVTFSGSGDEHLLGSSLNVFSGAFSVDKHSGTFYHQVNPKISEQITQTF